MKIPMSGNDFRERFLTAYAKAREGDPTFTWAELSRRTGVPYHTIDKLKRREGASTRAEYAVKLARALGFYVDDEVEYEAIRDRLAALDPERRRTAMGSVEDILAAYEKLK